MPPEIKELNEPYNRPSTITWHPANKSTLYMNGSGGHIWKTTDFGQSWATLLDYTKLAS